MELKFTIRGEPKGKGRPKFSRQGNIVRTYTPDATANYENYVKMEYWNQCGQRMFTKGGQLDMRLTAYFAIPASTSKKRQQLMRDKVIRPTKKPDMDNIIKIIADALNGIAYYDDSQIVDTAVRKFYSDEPRVVVKISEVES